MCSAEVPVRRHKSRHTGLRAHVAEPHRSKRLFASNIRDSQLLRQPSPPRGPGNSVPGHAVSSMLRLAGIASPLLPTPQRTVAGAGVG